MSTDPKALEAPAADTSTKELHRLARALNVIRSTSEPLGEWELRTILDAAAVLRALASQPAEPEGMETSRHERLAAMQAAGENGEEWTESLLRDLDRVLRENAKLRDEAFALAADTCHAGYAGEHGHHRCREVDEQRARAEKAEAELAALKQPVSSAEVEKACAVLEAVGSWPEPSPIDLLRRQARQSEEKDRALKPFADLLRWSDAADKDEVTSWHDNQGIGRRRITVGDLRRARAALSADHVGAAS